MSNADKLRDLIDNTWPAVIAGADNAITQLTDRKNELIDQIAGVEYALGLITSEITALLVSKGYDYNYYGPTYSVSNVIDWLLANNIIVTNLTFVDANTFDVDLDQTSVLIPGLVLLIDNGVDGVVVRTILSSTYNGPAPDTTTVVLDTGDPITVNLANIYELMYEYLGTGWDSDANIIAKIAAFDAAYDHLTLPLGLSGTYGLYDLLAKTNDGISLQTTNKNKYTSFLTAYASYAT